VCDLTVEGIRGAARARIGRVSWFDSDAAHPGIWVALDFIESLGDAGLCSIEARGHDATRAIYDTILGKA
jgi:hypothetical protein